MLAWPGRFDAVAAALALGVSLAPATASAQGASAADPPPSPVAGSSGLTTTATSPTGAAPPPAEPAATAAPPARTSEPAAATPAPTPHASNTLRTIGWVSIAVGAEAAIIAVVTSFMALHEKGVRDDNCNARKECTQVGLDANATLGTLFGWNTTSWIVAIAGLGVGTALVVTNRPIKNDQIALTVAPAAGGAALSLTGHF
jgi:hypothetical protein